MYEAVAGDDTNIFTKASFPAHGPFKSNRRFRELESKKQVTILFTMSSIYWQQHPPPTILSLRLVLLCHILRVLQENMPKLSYAVILSYQRNVYKLMIRIFHTKSQPRFSLLPTYTENIPAETVTNSIKLTEVVSLPYIKSTVKSHQGRSLGTYSYVR